ncbi:MAG: glycine cleavage system aminomethyltransferase GcvT [Candidatus Nanopelagicales bacterium]
MTLRQTPLHDEHIALGAKMADFGGWDMPIEYSGAVAEHDAVRGAVGVFDVSHMGYVEVRGPGATDWLNGILVNDLDRITEGQAQYSLLCDDDGGVIDDLIVYRVAPDAMFIIPNAVNVDAVVAALAAAAVDTGVQVVDASDAYGLLAVQGPGSAALLEELGLPAGHAFMSFVRSSWQGAPMVIARTGYTGELGFEILIPADRTVELWQALLAAGATPCGLGARDVLRTEMGYPLHGHELSADITPVQAGASWAVAWDKPTFAGKEALTLERETGPRRRLRGLLAEGRTIPRAGMSVLDAAGEVIGTVTSGTFSPSLGKGIGLALLNPAITEDAEVVVDIRGRAAPFTVVKPPFVEPHVR